MIWCHGRIKIELSSIIVNKISSGDKTAHRLDVHSTYLILTIAKYTEIIEISSNLDRRTCRVGFEFTLVLVCTERTWKHNGKIDKQNVQNL